MRLLASIWLLALVVSCRVAIAQEPQQTAAQESTVEAPSVAPAPVTLSPKESDIATPVTWKVRLSVFTHKLVGMQAFLETVPGAGSDHARNFPKQWGRGIDGLGMRLASQYGQFLVSEGIAMGMSSIHREDPRYYRRAEGPFGRRLGHALSSAVLTRNTHGRRTIAIGQIVGVYGSWGIATLWNPPDQRSFNGIAFYGSIGLSMKAGSNVFREFWPDVRKKLKKN